MFEPIKQLMFSVTGIIVTVLHVIFAYGGYHFACEAVAAWEGEEQQKLDPPTYKLRVK